MWVKLQERTDVNNAAGVVSLEATVMGVALGGKLNVEALNAAEGGAELASKLAIAGKVVSVAAAAISIVMVVDDIQTGHTQQAIIHGVDAAVGIISTVFPVLAPIALVYGVSRLFWGNGD